MVNKIDRTGEERIMNNGMKATIIKYRKYNDIDVIFEDGYISKHKKYDRFKDGGIGNPNASTVLLNNKNKIGETLKMNNGMKATIIEYRNCNDIDVQFEDGYISKHKRYDRFKIGSIGNPFVKQDCNFDINIYIHWKSMMKRCYSKTERINYPTYEDCIVCKEWQDYNNFKKWYNENYYEINDTKMELDKDILIKGNKIYSPETCVFVPQRINKLFTKNQAKRGNLPIGVCKQGNKYCASCSILDNDKTKYIKWLGAFNTPEEAFYAYKEFKEQYIKQVADEYKDKIPKKLYDAMYKYEVEITD